MKIGVEFGARAVDISLPDITDVLQAVGGKAIAEPQHAIQEALIQSIGSPGLSSIVKEKLSVNPQATAIVVISDNTRPVPYKDKDGILWPVVEILLECGISVDRLQILVATGTHRALLDSELHAMLDARIFERGIHVVNHDCKDLSKLSYLGVTERGSNVYVNSDYVRADIKILTGMVESHFMAGVSGGRKSVCPGLIAEDSINIFHGAAMLAEPKVESMILEANPCHEEALAVALMAGVDYIINVTLDHDFQVTGVFAGDLIQAHEKAVEHLRATTCIPVQREYDIVVAHAGFVGINHYQAAKVGVTAIPIVKPQGKLIVVADNTDIDPVGSPFYRTALHLLKHLGPEQFESLIQSSNWRFLPEQWQVQMWAKLFKKITFDDFVYYSPQLKAEDYVIVPGRNGNFYLPNSRMYQDELENIADVVETAVQSWMSSMQVQRSEEISIAYMADGPYGIPIVR